MNTKLQDKSKDVCCAQALLGRASKPFSSGHWSGLLLKKPLKNNAEAMKRTTKTGNSAILKNLFLRNEPNFNSVKLAATTCSMDGYNALQPKTKNGTNPNEANFFTTTNTLFSEELFSGNPCFFETLFLEYKANFKNSRLILTRETKGTYNDFCPQINKKSKANPKPIFPRIDSQYYLELAQLHPFIIDPKMVPYGLWKCCVLSFAEKTF